MEGVSGAINKERACEAMKFDMCLAIWLEIKNFRVFDLTQVVYVLFYIYANVIAIGWLEN